MIRARAIPPKQSTTMILGALLAMAMGAIRCSSGDDGSETASTGASTAAMCMNIASTSESCQIGGPSPGVCPESPKGWSGTQAPGTACTEATECAGIICKCDDPAVEWYVGVCACGECATYEVACAEANVVDCEKITPG